MFFIFSTGRRSKSTTAVDLEDLGEKVTKLMSSDANDGITVSIGKTDQAVMPYVWISRNPDTDQWEGQLGDSIKLGIDEVLLVERDPIRIFGLQEALMAGRAEVSNPPKPQKAAGPVKPSDDELQKQAKRMISDLFESLHDD